MEIVSLDLQDKEMVKKWDDFCLYESGAWFWHTTDWMKYTLAYRLDRNPVNKSFMVVEDGRVVAIVPLISEDMGKDGYWMKEFSYGAGPVPAPLVSKYVSVHHLREYYGVIRDVLRDIAGDYGVSCAMFQQSALCSIGAYDNFNSTYEYAQTDANTQVLILDRPFPALLRQMRKGHIYDVKHGMDMFNLHGVDQTSYTADAFRQYEQLHERANGRICRSHDTFMFQKEWVDKGNGLLFSAFKDGAPRGFVYVFLYKNKAYFGSACNDLEYRHLPIGHAIQGAVIQRLCLHGYKQYELGLQYGSEDTATEKEKNIAHFKHGFGGVTVVVPQWKKRYGTQTKEKQTSTFDTGALTWMGISG